MSQPVRTEIFRPEVLGKTLKPVAQDLIHLRGQKVTSRWLHSELGADLILWQDERGNLIKQHVSFWGQVVQWDIVHGLKTGLIIEMEEEEGSSAQLLGAAAPRNPVHYDSSVQKATLSQALEILAYVQELERGELALVVENFVQGPTMRDLGEREFLRRFSPRPAWVRRLDLWRHWLKSLFTWFRRS